MDREQKIRFLKEVLVASEKMKSEDNEQFNKLQKSLEEGVFSQTKDSNILVGLSEEQFDEVVQQSPWVVDAVFEMVEKFNTKEEVNFGQSETFKMQNLYQGIHDLMLRYQEHEKEEGSI